jgi:alpha-tubulin suppressor-like RCC1 family protein
LGNGATTGTAQPSLSTVIALPTDTTALSAGYYGQQFYALTASGDVWGWGDGAAYALGRNTTADATAPVLVFDRTGLTPIAHLTGGTAAALAIDSDGVAWVVGNNYEGRLGNGALATDIRVPEVILDQQAGGTLEAEVFIDAAIGYNETYLLADGGQVYGSGRNVEGQMGTGAITPANYTHYTPSSLSLVVAGQVEAIACGYGNASALAGGVLHSWGYGAAGALAQGSVSNVRQPTPVPTPWNTDWPSGLGCIAGYAASSLASGWCSPANLVYEAVGAYRNWISPTSTLPVTP